MARLNAHAKADDLKPVTVYLSTREIRDLNVDAAEAGRSGLSSQVRYILAVSRRERP